MAAGFGRHSMFAPAANYTDTPLGQDGSDRSRDLVTLTFDPGGHDACGWCGLSSSIRVPSLKFVGLGIRKIWPTMCVSINGPGDLDLWPFELETGKRVSSKVRNLRSEFGLARPSGSRVIRYEHLYSPDMYATDGRTDRQTDKSKAYCPIPYGRGDNNSIMHMPHTTSFYGLRKNDSQYVGHNSVSRLSVILQDRDIG